MRIKPISLVKTVAAAATPEALGGNLRMHFLQINADKGISTANTGNITVQVQDVDGNWVDYATMTPGEKTNWLLPSTQSADAAYFLASDFQIKVATNGDGVRVLYGQPN